MPRMSESANESPRRRVPRNSPCVRSQREKARLHPDMFPVKVRENNAAENASGNLFAFGQRPAIGMFHGIGGRDWSGYLHL